MHSVRFDLQTNTNVYNKVWLLSYWESYRCGINWLYFHHSYNIDIKTHYQLKEIDVLRNVSDSLLGTQGKYNQQ